MIDQSHADSYEARADGWMAACGNIRGKSGLHEDTAPGNARPEQSEGKRHRKQTAPARSG